MGRNEISLKNKIARMSINQMSDSLKLVGTGSQSKRPIYKPSAQCDSKKVRKNIAFASPQNATTVQYTVSATGAVTSSSNQFTDFLIDPSLGFLSDIVLRVGLQFSDTTHLPAIVPTSHFVSRVEYWTSDGTLLETVYPEQIYVRAVATIWDQDRSLISSTYNINSDGSQRNLYNNGSLAGNTYMGWVANNANLPANAAVPQSVVQSTSGYLYVPLGECALARSGIFIAAFSGEFKVRVYWASNIVSQIQINPVAAGGIYVGYPQTVQIVRPTLLLEENQVDAPAFQHVLNAGRQGVIDYNCLISERMQIINNSTFALNTPQNFYLTGLKNKSAGHMIHFQDPNPSADRILQRLSWAELQYLNAQGNRILGQLDEYDNLSTKQWGQQVDSTFPATADPDIASYALKSFCADMNEAFTKGCISGFVQWTGQEQISITPSLTAPPTGPGNPVNITGYPNPMLYITSYSIAHLSCVQGKAVVRFA